MNAGSRRKARKRLNMALLEHTHVAPDYDAVALSLLRFSTVAPNMGLVSDTLPYLSQSAPWRGLDDVAVRHNEMTDKVSGCENPACGAPGAMS